VFKLAAAAGVFAQSLIFYLISLALIKTGLGLGAVALGLDHLVLVLNELAL